METLIKAMGTVAVLLIFMMVIGLILAFPVKWTWNATMPEIWGLIEITWSQAWCLNFLAGCLIQSTLSHNSDS